MDISLALRVKVSYNTAVLAQNIIDIAHEVAEVPVEAVVVATPAMG